MATKRPRSVPRRIPVIYSDGVVRVEYVARAPSELSVEFRRVQRHILETIRILSTMKRIRHHIIKSARFQLSQAIREFEPGTCTEDAIAAEIARLSYLMEDTLNILNRLSCCRVANLEAARFKLTYGQTPKKRDPPETYGSREKRQKEVSDGSDFNSGD